MRTVLHISTLTLAMALLMVGNKLMGQSVTGLLTDEKQNPIEYASVFIKETRQGTSSNNRGQFIINLPKGTYTFVFRCIGFETVERTVEVTDKPAPLNVTMQIRPYELALVTVGNTKEDAAYSTMRKAISMAPYYLNQIKEFDAEVYMKGTLKVKKVTLVLKQLLKDEMDVPKPGDVLMQESMNEIHFTAPDKYEQKVKMIRSNLPFIEGSDVMGFVNANLYAPMIGGEIILPLSPQAFKHYTFKDVGYTIQGDRYISKIKVTPKRKSKQLVEGYIYIADEHYNLHEVDLLVNTIAGTIRVRQTFGEVEKNVWVPVSHHFDVVAKFMGNEADGWYVSSMKYNSIKLNTKLQKPTNLLAVEAREQKQAASTIQATAPTKQTSKQQLRLEKEEAKLTELLQKDNPSTREMHQMVALMQKQVQRSDTILGKNAQEDVPGYYRTTVDSTARKINPKQWDATRPVVLSDDEIKVDKQINSMVDTTGGRNKVEFKRSPLNIMLTGIRWRNPNGDLRITYSGLISLDQIDFNTVDGLALNAMTRIRKDLKNSSLEFYTSAGYAFSAQKPRIRTYLQATYAPEHRGTARLDLKYTNADFNSINGINRQVNSLTSLLMGRNYLKLYEEFNMQVSNRISPMIGFDIYVAASAHRRRTIANNTDFVLIPPLRKHYTSNNPVNPFIDSTSNLANQQLLKGEIGLYYTPLQRFTRDGSRIAYTRTSYPTLGAQLRWAFPSAMKSVTKFINWEMSIRQSIDIGAFSELNYVAIYGGFANTQNVHFADYKHFNTQLAYFTFSDFGNSFQTLNYYQYSTCKQYVQLLANYRTPYLLLKLLPWVSERMWNENLHLSALNTEQLKPYYELGYSINQIVAVAGVGVFMGFDGNKFNSVMVKASIVF